MIAKRDYVFVMTKNCKFNPFRRSYKVKVIRRGMHDKKEKNRVHIVRTFNRLMEVLVKRKKRINKDKQKNCNTTTDKVKKLRRR
jgi:hypothetical protein